jgi:hypothetical protein
LDDRGAKILIPAGVNESKTIWEKRPKNKLKTISIYEISITGMTNNAMKNNGRKIISSFLFKKRKLKRAIRMAISR